MMTDYDVTESGIVVNAKTGRVLHQYKSKHGYLRVALYENGKQKRVLVHRIVAMKYIPNPHNLPQVNHKNGIKTDNRVENLEWVTCKENIIHSYKNGLQPHAKKVKCIETNEIFISQSEACKKYKISRTNLSYCVNGKRRTVGGLHWERVF